jgi:hypothetical protein
LGSSVSLMGLARFGSLFSLLFWISLTWGPPWH